MGKEKYLKEIEGFFKKSPVVSSKSIKNIIKNKNKKTKLYYKQLIRALILKNKIRSLTKGYYTIHEDPSLIVLCLKPSYLGLQDALSFHNLWEQETIPVIITARKIRQGIRRVNNTNILIRRINQKYFLGFDYYKNDGFYLPYSDMEKTLIDLIYFKEKIDKRVLQELIRRINKKKLYSYLKFYPKRIRKIIKNIIISNNGNPIQQRILKHQSNS